MTCCCNFTRFSWFYFKTWEAKRVKKIGKVKFLNFNSRRSSTVMVGSYVSMCWDCHKKRQSGMTSSHSYCYLRKSEKAWAAAAVCLLVSATPRGAPPRYSVLSVYRLSQYWPSVYACGLRTDTQPCRHWPKYHFHVIRELGTMRLQCLCCILSLPHVMRPIDR